MIFSKHEGSVIQCKQTLMILLHLLNCVFRYCNNMMIKKNHKANILIEVIVIKFKRKKSWKFKRKKNMELGNQIQCNFGIGLLPISLETSVLLIDGRFYFRYGPITEVILIHGSQWERQNVGVNNVGSIYTYKHESCPRFQKPLKLPAS